MGDGDTMQCRGAGRKLFERVKIRVRDQVRHQLFRREQRAIVRELWECRGDLADDGSTL